MSSNTYLGEKQDTLCLSVWKILVWSVQVSSEIDVISFEQANVLLLKSVIRFEEFKNNCT